MDGRDGLAHTNANILAITQRYNTLKRIQDESLERIARDIVFLSQIKSSCTNLSNSF